VKTRNETSILKKKRKEKKKKRKKQVYSSVLFLQVPRTPLPQSFAQE
jgi:hypothetical protein